MASLRLQPLHIVPYNPRSQVKRPRTYLFSTDGTPGYSLLDVERGSFEKLDDRQDTILPPEYDKVRFSLHIVGLKRVVYDKNTQRIAGGIKQPSSRIEVLRHIVAFWGVIVRETAEMRSCGSIPLGPGGIELKHLYIDTLHQYGKTFEPIFKYDAAMVAQDALDYETIPRLLISNGSQSESTYLSWTKSKNQLQSFAMPPPGAHSNVAQVPPSEQSSLDVVIERLNRIERSIESLHAVIAPRRQLQAEHVYAAQPTISPAWSPSTTNSIYPTAAVPAQYLPLQNDGSRTTGGGTGAAIAGPSKIGHGGYEAQQDASGGWAAWLSEMGIVGEFTSPYAGDMGAGYDNSYNE